MNVFDPAKLTLEDFLMEDPTQGGSVDWDVFRQLVDDLRKNIGEKVVSLGSGYSICKMSGCESDCLLIYEGAPVGCYCGATLAIDERHQGKGLSIPLILETIRLRPRPEPRRLSPAGKRALTKAWKVANGILPNPWPSQYG